MLRWDGKKRDSRFESLKTQRIWKCELKYIWVVVSNYVFVHPLFGEDEPILTNTFQLPWHPWDWYISLHLP